MSTRYNLKKIRVLLSEGFTDDQLRRLCYDEPDFRPVYERLAQSTGKVDIIDWLLEHAERTLQLDRLLAVVKEYNPAKYNQHQPYRLDTPEAPAASSFIRQPFEPEMILITAGTFIMGSDPKQDEYAREDEQPYHRLYLPDYYLAKSPVTNAQYLAFVQSTRHWPPAHWEGRKLSKGREDHPVVNISWNDAIAYCRWLAKVTGQPYCLPSEAEWEKGARGSDGRLYPWGNQWDRQRCNSREGGSLDTTPVGAYPGGASPYGLLDMAGNVLEWTRSLHAPYPYDPKDGREDLEVQEARVLRGGSGGDNRFTVRCALRLRHDPIIRYEARGFRVAISPTFCK